MYHVMAYICNLCAFVSLLFTFWKRNLCGHRNLQNYWLHWNYEPLKCKTARIWHYVSNRRSQPIVYHATPGAISRTYDKHATINQHNITSMETRCDY